MKRHVLCLALLTGLLACRASNHPLTPAEIKSPGTDWPADLSAPGVLEHEAVTSGTWKVALSGMLNLEHEAAAHLEDRDMPIVLAVHVLRHPKHGVFIIDTGVSSKRAGGDDGVGWPVSSLLDELVTVESLAAILGRQPGPLAGVFMTHTHLDHILGMPDVPKDTPIYLGPGELEVSKFENMFISGTYTNLFEGRPAFKELDFAQAVKVGGNVAAIDVFGDGTLWALHVPGHTPGSLAFIARTTTGAKLFTGDCSHTHWGFEHGVEPGEYTEDHTENRASLNVLRDLAQANPAMQVFVGHELESKLVIAQGAP